MVQQWEKWLAGGIALSMLLAFAAGAFTFYQTHSCKLELARAGRNADDIVKICQ